METLTKEQKILKLLCITLLWALLYLPSLGSLQIDFDEHKRILPAISMLESGEWAVPKLADQSYFNKPPLINWTIALSFKAIGGKSELAARLPSALSVLVFCLAVVLLRSTFLTKDAKFISALIFMTSASVFMKGRQAEIDAFYTVLTGLANFIWLSFYYSSEKWKAWIFAFIVLGIGLLLKGPMILLFFYVTVLSVLLGTKSVKDFFSLQHLCGFVIMLGIFLAWALTARHNLAQGIGNVQDPTAATDAKITSTWLHELFLRFHDNMKIGKWAGNVLSAFAGFAPWIVFVPFLWNKNWLSEIPETDRKFFQLARNGTVIAFSLVCLMPGTRARYSMPAFAMLSILVGWLLAYQKSRPIISDLWRKLLTILFPVIAFVARLSFLIGLALFLLICLDKRVPDYLKVFGLGWNILMLAGSALFASFAVFLFSKIAERGKNFHDFTQFVFFTVVLLSAISLFYSTALIPPIASQGIFPKIGAEINACVPSSERIYAYKVGSEHFLFYIDRRVQHLKKLHELPDEAKFCLIEKSQYDENANYPFFTLRKPEILDVFKSDKRQFVLLKFWECYRCPKK